MKIKKCYMCNGFIIDSDIKIIKILHPKAVITLSYSVNYCEHGCICIEPEEAKRVNDLLNKLIQILNKISLS